jgi:hypothetical protein
MQIGVEIEIIRIFFHKHSVGNFWLFMKIQNSDPATKYSTRRRALQ